MWEIDVMYTRCYVCCALHVQEMGVHPLRGCVPCVLVPRYAGDRC